jgi:WD40 repeat protein
MDDTLRVWDLTRRHAKPQIFKSHEQSISAVALTPDGRLAISGTEDGVLKIWDLTRAKAEPHAIDGRTSNIRKIAITPDGCLAVTCSNDPTIHVWDLKRFQLLAAFTGSSIINSVSISDHGRVIFAGGSLGEIYLLQLDGWRKTQQL